MVVDGEDFIAQISPELSAVIKVQTGKAKFSANDFEQPKELQEIVGLILQLDYEDAREQYEYAESRGAKEAGPFKVIYENVHVSPFNEKYWVNFTRIPDNRRWFCWYQFVPNMTDFASVYEARLDHLVLSRDSREKIHKIGQFADLLDESPEDRLKRLFKSGGIKVLSKAVYHNTSGDYHWRDKNSLKLLGRGNISVDEYLEKAAYIIEPYEINTMPSKIKQLQEQGHQRFIEVWCSDVSFGGHIQRDTRL